jgi:lipoprotein-releasing system ATP-binding protein
MKRSCQDAAPEASWFLRKPETAFSNSSFWSFAKGDLPKGESVAYSITPMTFPTQAIPNSSLLVAQSLTKIYRGAGAEVTVFQDLDLTVQKGEMIAIVGASGAGKSTLLQVLGGLDQPTSGSVILGDFDIFKNGELQLAALRNRRIGFVFQFHHLLPEFSALENVMMPLLISGQKRIEAEGRARDLLLRVGLETRLAHRPGELSGGERQRVALARALVMSPSLLLADEPTGNLDQRTGEEVFALIRQLHAEEHLTSILVTHNEQLAATCDRVLRLAHGTLT